MTKLDEPILMAHQGHAFNNDIFVQAEFKKLQKEFGLKMAIETGTFYGHTTEFLAKVFDQVRTVEVREDFQQIAKTNRLNALENVTCYLGSSSDLMPKMLEGCGDDTMVFLDAHWQQHCPLKDELQAIADMGIEPCIAIHDFLNPNRPDFGYDSIGNQPFTYEWLKEDIDAIYGEDNYDYYYNEEATEVKRGLIYITPKL